MATLQHVGPHHRLHSATEGVEQDDADEHHRDSPEGHTPSPEDKLVEHKYHQVHAQRRPHEAGDNEKEGSGPLGGDAETLLEIAIDRGEAEPVIQRQQHKGDDRIAQHIAEHQGHIGELAVVHPSRHREERHPGKRSPDHAVSHHRPRRLALPTEKGIVARRLARREPHHRKKQHRVSHKTD